MEMVSKLRHGSLFSGIGGFDLAAEWMGWENIFYCEIEEFCRKVLKHYFPKSKGYEDIRKTDFTEQCGKVDIITGGFPCQPFSVAGKRLGTGDERHLWPEMFRAIREARPAWVVAENVRGLISWNEGLVFEAVCAELEAEGYKVTPFLIPAAGVGAPHRRERVWIVAYAECYDDFSKESRGHGAAKEMAGVDRSENSPSRKFGRTGHDDTGRIVDHVNDSTEGDASNPISRTEQIEWYETRKYGKAYHGGKTKRPEFSYISDYWKNWPTEPPLCSGDDGLSKELAGITLSKWRNESITSLGNAIVPQVAYQIFKAIKAYYNNFSHR